MEIGENYVEDMIRAIRRNKSENTIVEVQDLIREARADLIGAGVSKEKANDENDSLIKGAVQCFVKWKFGISKQENVEGYRRDYIDLKENIRRNAEYMEVK